MKANISSIGITASMAYRGIEMAGGKSQHKWRNGSMALAA